MTLFIKKIQVKKEYLRITNLISLKKWWGIVLLLYIQGLLNINLSSHALKTQ